MQTPCQGPFPRAAGAGGRGDAGGATGREDHIRWHREGRSKEEAAGTRRKSGNKATAEGKIQQKGNTLAGREEKKDLPGIARGEQRSRRV